MSLDHYQPLVTRLVRDDASRITEEDRDNAIELALRRYSQDRPQTKVEDVVSDGTTLLDLPASWEAGFSQLASLEYPIGNNPPTLLSGWQLYLSPSAAQIMLVSAPTSGASVRATYTIRQVLTYAADTVPLEHREPLASYAASVLCEQLASLYSGDTDSTIGADSVEHRSKAQEFAARARGLRQRYFDALGIDPKRAVPAGVVVDVDMPSSLGGGRLTHPERYR